MENFEPDTYGDRIADLYDLWVDRADTPATVDTLVSLAGPGPVLELAVGTGRVAIPLAEAGLTVHGIDASEAMLDRLRSKPGGDTVAVTKGNMADVAVDQEFSLVFVVFNSFFCLLTQDDQVRCFANSAAHLKPGGFFVLEGFVPDVTLYERGQRVSVSRLELGHVRLDVTRHWQNDQLVETQHVVISDNGRRLVPV
ncbi:MAG: class I SAM-dependent DNA methyltransferase, partial [Mycobacteriales bacterium]